MEAASLKAAVFEQFARLGKALSSPARLELLELLIQAPRTVEVLADMAHQSPANASHHLQVLKAARLVEAEKTGQFVTYRVADPQVVKLWREFQATAEQRLAEISQLSQEWLRQRGVFEAVDRETLIERIRNGDAVVIDVRPAEEYAAGHIDGAISVPMAELEQRIHELPAGRDIIAYCRGPYCVMALDAVERLRAVGRNANRFDAGAAEWRELGLDVVTDDGDE